MLPRLSANALDIEDSLSLARLLLHELNKSKKLLTTVPCAFILSIEHVQNISNDDFDQESGSDLRPDS
jgi:hypothetical protein